VSEPHPDSDYPPCERCYATLCVESEDIDPARVTACLDVQPSDAHVKGEVASAFIGAYPFSGWYLSSKNRVDSRDLRRHLDWVFEQIAPKKLEIESLRATGCSFSIACYWLSATGNGGPVLSVPQVKRLAEFELEIWIDIYFLGGPDPEREARDQLSAPGDGSSASSA
jgi:Domain of unknown function (DUF4279)